QVFLDRYIDLQIRAVLLARGSSLLLIALLQPVVAENKVVPPEPAAAIVLRLSQLIQQVALLHQLERDFFRAGDRPLPGVDFVFVLLPLGLALVAALTRLAS